MGKKNLDKLFQEKLKDFSEMPDDKVWRSIETSLDGKKKSRKAIPIWWKFGGVAAVLLIALTLVNPFEDNPSNTPAITNVKVDTVKTSEAEKSNQTFENNNSKKEQVVDNQQETVPVKEEEQIIDVRKRIISPNKENAAVDQLTNTNSTSKESLRSNAVNKTFKKEEIAIQNDSGVGVASSNNEELQKTLEQNKFDNDTNNFDNSNQEMELAESGVSKTDVEQNLSLENLEVEDNLLSNEIPNSKEEGIAQNNTKKTAEAIDEESEKKSIFDEIAAQEQEDEDVLAENSGSKWSAGPRVAPVYYNAVGEGSPVHSVFVPNSKSGDINLSYGLSIAYEVSTKLSIRSGIHKVDYGYRTNDVEFSSSLANATSNQFNNIDYTLTSSSLVLSSKVNTAAEASSQDQFVVTSSEDISAPSPTRDGILLQQFGYLEVPIELNYTIVDNRFGVNLIGGISSLFLVDNSISLSSGELTTDVGEANNLNSVNFSTNVGFGLNYKITPKVKLNIEPVFKYQLNTFSETDGTFNPFSVGVYSGLNFKF